MRTGTIVKALAFMTAIGVHAGCCGLLTDGGESENTRTTRTKPRTESRTSSRNFAGKYEIVDEEYDDLSLVIRKEGEYYSLMWGVPASEPWFATGVELAGYLCASTSGEDGIVGIYQKQGTEIAGLWLSEGEYVLDITNDASPLEPSSYDFSGTYSVEALDATAGESYTYTLTIKKSGNAYKATEFFEDGIAVSGDAIAVGRMIVMGFPIGGSLVTRAFRKSGTELEGKFFYTYYNDESGEEEVVTGTEMGEKE